MYDYIPSVATLQSVFIDSPTLKQNGIGGIPEHVIWVGAGIELGVSR